ncbi:MAG: ATP-binding cassette domain-containing protein [Magnetococcales bacterium]|nr:ATP-binding cassette domain-containing protein [Magnetococcales bacterium]
MILDIKNLSKQFRLDRKRILHAVDRVSLGIQRHEVMGLVGESGSGKSTLARVVVGLLEKTAGEIVFEGERLPDRFTPRELRRLGSRMQMIFQDPFSSLNPRMTVMELIGEGLRLQGLVRGEGAVRERVAYWLERVGLHPDHMARYPHEFSGGQRQRIGIARALVVEPRFLVCDEPVSALDLSVQAQIVRLLDELKASLGLSMLFIAHDLSLVRHVSDRMTVMYRGGIVESGPADLIFFQPRHPYTRLLVAANPVPDPIRERQRLRPLVQGEIASPINLGPGCRFASRCPEALPHCHQTPPGPTLLADGRSVVCHLAKG